MLRRRLRLRPLARLAAAARELDEAALAAAARALARDLRPGDVVHLVGPLGAGKTTFVGYAAGALGVTEPVTSPTFAVAHRYRGRDGDVSHLDLYRADVLTPAAAADLEPYLDEAAIAFVEWPAAGAELLPEPTWIVELDHAGESTRLVRVRRADDR